MPSKSNKPKEDLSHFLNLCGNNFIKDYHKDELSEFHTKIHFLDFLVQAKASFLNDAGKTETQYYQLIKKVWSKLSNTQINTAKDTGSTTLMRILHFTKTYDCKTVLLAIENTKPQGINAFCTNKSSGESYALLAIISEARKECIPAIIEKSNKKCLNLAKHFFSTYSFAKQTNCKIKNLYTSNEITLYTRMINQKLFQLKLSWVPFANSIYQALAIPKTSSSAVLATKFRAPPAVAAATPFTAVPLTQQLRTNPY